MLRLQRLLADQIATLDLPDHERPGRSDGAMLWGDGFEIQTVINCRFAAAEVRITEVPSVERLRIFGDSNLHAVKDGLRVLRTIRTEHVRARRARHGGARRERRGVGELSRIAS